MTSEEKRMSFWRYCHYVDQPSLALNTYKPVLITGISHHSRLQRALQNTDSWSQDVEPNLLNPGPEIFIWKRSSETLGLVRQPQLGSFPPRHPFLITWSISSWSVRGSHAPAYLSMYFGVRTTVGTTEDLTLPLTGVRAPSTLILVVTSAGPWALRVMLRLEQTEGACPFFLRVFKAEEVLTSPGWDLLGGEAVSEEAGFRLQFFWDSKESHEIFCDSLMVGFLGTPKPKETMRDVRLKPPNLILYWSNTIEVSHT